MPRKPRGSLRYWPSRDRCSTSIAALPGGSRGERPTCRRPGLPIISGRPPWTSSRSISRTMLRTSGSWAKSDYRPFHPSSFRGDAKHRTSDAQLRIGESRDSGSGAGAPSRNDGVSLSLPSPLRRPFFRERLRTLDIVLRRHHRFHGGIVALFRDGLFQRHAEPLLDRLL